MRLLDVEPPPPVIPEQRALHCEPAVHERDVQAFEVRLRRQLEGEAERRTLGAFFGPAAQDQHVAFDFSLRPGNPASRCR